MEADVMKTLARRFREDFVNARDAAIAEEILSDAFVYHGPAMAPRLSREETIAGIVASFEAMPDICEGILEQYVDGDRVISRFATSGTFGEHSLDTWGIDIMRIADDRIAEMWVQFDTLTFASFNEIVQRAITDTK